MSRRSNTTPTKWGEGGSHDKLVRAVKYDSAAAPSFVRRERDVRRPVRW